MKMAIQYTTSRYLEEQKFKKLKGLIVHPSIFTHYQDLLIATLLTQSANTKVVYPATRLLRRQASGNKADGLKSLDFRPVWIGRPVRHEEYHTARERIQCLNAAIWFDSNSEHEMSELTSMRPNEIAADNGR